MYGCCTVVTYEVTVVTGDLWNAGTNANVYLTLCGEHGDTGMRQLFRSRNTQKKFQAGQVQLGVISFTYSLLMFVFRCFALVLAVDF